MKPKKTKETTAPGTKAANAKLEAAWETATAAKRPVSNRIRNTFDLAEILVQGGNPNGDPDENGAPRTNAYGMGIINGTAIKRQPRDMIVDRSPAFLDAAEKLGLNPEGYDIYVRPDLSITELGKMSADEFTARFWDARVFGSCLLTGSSDGAGGKTKPQTPPTRGVIQVEDAESLAPVIIADRSGTRKSGVEEGKDKGMRDRKVVTHGLYRCVMIISDRRGNTSGATDKDIELFLELVKNIYSQNSEASRGTRLESLYTFEPNTSITVSQFERGVGLKLKDGVTTPASIEDYTERDSTALKARGTLTRLV